MLKLINHKNIFLIDAVGAFMSLAGLVIIYNYLNCFNLPRYIVQLLMVFPCIYMVFSSCCYITKLEKVKTPLFIIAIANLIYTIITTTVIFKYYPVIKTEGLFYFIAEILILIYIVVLEFILGMRAKN